MATTTFSMDEFLEERIAAGTIPWDFRGEEFEFPAPELWPDTLPNPVRSGFDSLGRAILGDEQWERYAALGGTGRALNAFYDSVSRRTQGVDVGESSASDAS